MTMTHAPIVERVAGWSVRHRKTAVIGWLLLVAVVTSAAVIMVAVFSIFATLGLIEFKMFGVGMAVAVLIDATVVRGVLLPAGLALLGDRAWSKASRRADRRDGAIAAVAGSEPLPQWSPARTAVESARRS